MLTIPKLYPNMIVELKKQHPCGNSLFRIVRVGSDVRIICQQCERDLVMDRAKLEKSIKKILPPQENNS